MEKEKKVVETNPAQEKTADQIIKENTALRDAEIKELKRKNEAELKQRLASTDSKEERKRIKEQNKVDLYNQISEIKNKYNDLLAHSLPSGANKDKRHMGMKSKRIIGNTTIYIILIIMTFIWLFPFVCILLQSFRVESTHMVGYIIPKQWGFDNYINLFTKKAFNDGGFGRWYFNTLIISIFVALIQTIIVLCMSYTLSRIRFKGRKFLMNFMLILGMFPGMLTMIILYRVLKDMGLTESHAIPGLILVYVASSGMGYYVSKGFFDTLPKSLDEAARVDGANRAQVFFKVILPLSKPIVIYTLLTAFMGPWGDYIFATYVAHHEETGMNVAVGLQNLISSEQSINANYTMFCAGGVLVAIPITILFMILQKYYVEGVTGGAVKG